MRIPGQIDQIPYFHRIQAGFCGNGGLESFAIDQLEQSIFGIKQGTIPIEGAILND